jgi:hypothetical protein
MVICHGDYFENSASACRPFSIGLSPRAPGNDFIWLLSQLTLKHGIVNMVVKTSFSQRNGRR